MAQDTEQEFRHESLQDGRSIARYLRALTEGFEQGSISVGSDDKRIVFEPEGLLEFELRAKRKGDRVRLVVKIGWREDTDDAASTETLRIES